MEETGENIQQELLGGIALLEFTGGLENRVSSKEKNKTEGDKRDLLEK